jgi:pilus assembly protein CpaF
MHDVFVFEQTGVDEQRVAQGRFAASGIRPNCLDRILSAGINVNPAIFQRRVLAIDRVDALEVRGTRA